MLQLQALTLALAGNPAPIIIIVAVIAVLAIICIANMHVVPQGKAYVVEHLGSYRKTWQTGGIKFTIPFFQKVAKKINLMEQVADFPPQPVITKDNVRMQIDTVVFFQITDCKLYAYGHTTPMTAIENLTSTTLRNIIGELELDATLTSRDLINTQMRSILDEATDPWGIKVTRVELKNIIPPKEIQDATSSAPVHPPPPRRVVSPKTTPIHAPPLPSAQTITTPSNSPSPHTPMIIPQASCPWATNRPSLHLATGTSPPSPVIPAFRHLAAPLRSPLCSAAPLLRPTVLHGFESL